MKQINQNHFIAALVVLTCILGYSAQQLTQENLQIVAVKMINGSLTLGIPSLFIHFLRGTAYDVYEEIFDNKNVAAAILLGLAWVAFALSATVVS